ALRALGYPNVPIVARGARGPVTVPSQSKDQRVRLVHVVTVPQTFCLLEGQARFMVEHGIEFIGVSAPGAYQEVFQAREPVTLISIPMSRQITPVRDVVALIRLIALLRQLRPDLVHAHTPKGGLLGMIAAWVV